MYLKLPGIYDEERNATGYVVQSAGPIPLALEWLSRRYNFTWKWLDNNQFIVKPYEITQILIALKAIHSFNIYTYNMFYFVNYCFTLLDIRTFPWWDLYS